MRIGDVGHFLKQRVIDSYKTTTVGCFLIALLAVGEHLQTIGEYAQYGKIIAAGATIIGAIGQILRKDEVNGR
jgi:hypothetical protein